MKNSTHSKREKIEEAARKLGASDWAIRKWWDRGGVPAKWQIEIINHDHSISLSDFIDAAKAEHAA